MQNSPSFQEGVPEGQGGCLNECFSILLPRPMASPSKIEGEFRLSELPRCKYSVNCNDIAMMNNNDTKKGRNFATFFFAGDERIELPSAVLETVILPLN